MDYAGPFLKTMFLVVIDAHTKWAEIIPTSSTKHQVRSIYLEPFLQDLDYPINLLVTMDHNSFLKNSTDLSLTMALNILPAHHINLPQMDLLKDLFKASNMQ